jgi:nucleoside-diphosphate kinase
MRPPSCLPSGARKQKAEGRKHRQFWFLVFAFYFCLLLSAFCLLYNPRAMTQRTLTIVKPDAVERGFFGRITQRLEAEGFKVIGIKKMNLSKGLAEAFYAIHRERPFFADLVRYMTSGPVYVAVLERDDAVAHLRKAMGATDPAKADAGTLRKEFGESIERNAIHGSDSPENAAAEIAFFFAGTELL